MLNFRTDRLLLRPFVPEDIQNVFHGLSHPDVIKYYGVNFSSLEATKEQMQWFSDLEKSGAGIWWAICSLDNKKFYGACGFNNLSQENKKAEIGFWLLPEFWGRGIVQEASKEIIDYAFNELNLHRIEGLVEAGNENSSKALRKLGFQHEGSMRDCEIKNGKFISLDIFALLNQE